MSPASRGSVWVVALALALLSACGGRRQAGPGPALDLERLLPDAATMTPWRVAEGPVEYRPGTLYEYLDGGAERYVGHGFRRLLHVRYQPGDRDADSVTLDLFDMGSELGAFGIYSSIRPLDAEFTRWGVEGYRVESVAAAWKGRLFVHAEADSGQAPLLAMLERLVGGACDRFEASSSPPVMLAVLPAEGLVPRSERVAAADLLGHECLPGGVVAAYAAADGRAELYFSDLGDGTRAAAALAELRAHFRRSAGGVGESVLPGVEGFSFRDPVLGTGAVITRGRFVAGIHGTMPAKAQRNLLAELADRLASPPTPRG